MLKTSEICYLIFIILIIILYFRLWIYLMFKDKRDTYYHIAFVVLVLMYMFFLYDYRKPTK